MKQKMQEVAFQIIAQVGTAKSMYITALKLAKEQKFEEARKMVEDADAIYAEGHKLHFDIIQVEAQGEDVPFSLIFMHAEDQMLNTETIKLLTTEVIELREEKVNK